MKVGDVLICIDVEIALDLTINKIYTAIEVKNNIGGVRVYNDKGILREYYQTRFKKLEDLRNEKLNELGI